jgi:hypothetical protein
MRLLATSCDDGNCPKVFETDSGDLVIQGYTLSPAELGDLPAGESRVQIPRAVFVDLMTKLGTR